MEASRTAEGGGSGDDACFAWKPWYSVFFCLLGFNDDKLENLVHVTSFLIFFSVCLASV